MEIFLIWCLLALTSFAESREVEVIDYIKFLVEDAFNGSYYTKDVGKKEQDFWPMSRNFSYPPSTTNKTTICMALNIWTLDWRSGTLINFYNSEKTMFILDSAFTDASFTPGKGFNGKLFFSDYMCNGNKMNVVEDIHSFIPEWHWVCVEFDSAQKSVTVRWRQKEIYKHVCPDDKPYRDDVVARIQNYNEVLGEVHIYDKPLAEVECGDVGNLLPWNASNYNNSLEGYRSMVNIDRICGKDVAYQVAVPVKLNYDMANYTCSNLGRGTFPVYRSFDNWLEYWPQAKKDAGVDGTLAWWPFKSKNPPEISSYILVGGTEQLNETFWNKGQPNEDDGECVMCNMGCSDKACFAEYASVCRFEHSPSLSLRGLCKDTELDVYYYPVNMMGQFMWLGTRRTFIRYNRDTYQWEARMSGSDIYALSGASYSSFLLGQSTWEVYNDRRCFAGDTNTIKLSMTSCIPGQFNCRDGSCISLDSRCDGVNNCNDGSDEIDCHIIKISGSYNKQLASRSEGRAKADLNFDVEIEKILEVQENEGRIRINVKIILEWIDRRLVFLNLRANTKMNKLSEEEYDQVWKPNLVVPNMEFSLENERRIPKITILRKSEPKLSSFDSLYGAQEYSGEENPIRWTWEVRPFFLCDFNMNNYPFDIQVCTIQMTLEERQLLTANLEIGDIMFKGDLAVDQYSVDNYVLCKEVVEEEEFIIAKITISRGLFDSFMTECLPAMIANIIGHLTNYFYKHNFDAAVGVNLTLLLVLTTMLLGISAELPNSDRIKFVEIWMLFSLLLPFIEVILQTYIYKQMADEENERDEDPGDSVSFMRNSESDMRVEIKKATLKRRDVNKYQKKIKRVRFILLVVKPIVYILFVVVYWIVGMAILLTDSSKLGC